MFLIFLVISASTLMLLRNIVDYIHDHTNTLRAECTLTICNLAANHLHLHAAEAVCARLCVTHVRMVGVRSV